GGGEIARIELSPRATLDSFYEKQLAKLFQDPQPAWDSYLWPPSPEPAPSSLIPSSQIRNLSSNFAAGRLTWDVPPGQWIVQRIGMSPTGVHNAPAPPEATGFEIDKMSRAHVTRHFNEFMGRIFQSIPPADRPAWRHVVADSYEVGSQNWTDDLARDFTARYHYDPLPYLPVLSGRIVNSASQSDRFLWDLRRLVADRIATHYVGALRDLAQQHNLRLWLENYGHWGFASEFLYYGSQSHEIGGEFWTTGQLGETEIRAAASAAHIYGMPIVHSESFTSSATAFTFDPWRLKLRGDWASTLGVNHVVLHVYTSQPSEKKPGLNWWAGIEMQRHNTWFEASTAWIDYQRRRDFLLQQGLPVADIAYFIGEDAPKMRGSHVPAPPPGYAYDDINADAILHRLTVQNGRFVLPNGHSFRVLVLPPQTTMRPALLRRLSQLIASGGIVLGEPPTQSPSLENYPAADRELSALAAEIWKDCDGAARRSAPYGQGRIYRNVELQTIFDDLHLLPDVAPTFPFAHRRGDEADIYFLSNQTDEAVTKSIAFRTTGRQPELWDAVTGAHRDLPAFQHANGQTTIELTFEPRQSHFILFRRPAPPKPSTRPNFPKLQTLADLSNPWQVTFDPAYGGPGTVKFEKLQDWTTRPEPGIKAYSGTAIYKTTLQAPATKSKVYLDLGPLSSLAKVTLNGHPTGTIWCAPWRLEVTDLLKPGENTLEVEVTNTWLNRILADRANPAAPPIAPTPVNISPQAKPLPAGLFGPARLTAPAAP
ncbi:MAG: glycoside hydrolase family 2, partial [Acidobacteria bacterium]|nr:glycoside hydrolase family 2 [Acidobacteriota bacterium]